jgi:hypothetical protein
LALLVGATTYSSAVWPFLNLELIPFFPAAVYPSQILIVTGIFALARKIAAENRGKMKHPAAVGINDSCNHRRNGWTHILDMLDVENGSVVDFGIVQKANTSGWATVREAAMDLKWSNEADGEEIGK